MAGSRRQAVIQFAGLVFEYCRRVRDIQASTTLTEFVAYAGTTGLDFF